DHPDQRLHRQAIATRAETRQHGRRYGRDQRLVVDLLAPVNIRDVELDDWPGKHLERIEQRNGAEGEARRIDEDARALVNRLMHPVDELVLGIGLVEADGRLTRRLAAPGLDLGQRDRAVDFRLPRAEAVEVRSVKDENR